MSTYTIDYCRVLVEAGILNNSGRYRVFNYQQYHTYEDIADYRNFSISIGKPLTIHELLPECRFASLDDMLKTINTAMDEPLSPTTKGVRHGWSWDPVFLAHYGFIEEFWNEIDTWKGPIIFFCDGLTPIQRIEIYDKIRHKTADDIIGSDSVRTMLAISMVAKPNWLGGKGLWFTQRPMNEIIEGMKVLCEESPKRQIEIAWDAISAVAPIEYISSNPALPWTWRYVGQNQYNDMRVITANAHLPWNGRILAESKYATLGDLLACPITRPYMNSAEVVPKKHRDKVRYGIWEWIRHADSWIFPQVFMWHGAAGVIQRSWRRHKERLRRRKYATEWLGTVLLDNFPKDIQWMIYRYTRPAGVERGLPPKLR